MNFLRFTIILAWRNLWRSRKRTLITVSSIFFAVFLAISLESMNVGSHEQIIANMVRLSSGYGQFQDSLYLKEKSLDNTIEFTEVFRSQLESELPSNVYFVPRLETFALVAAESTTRSAMITGVDFGKENQISRLTEKLVEGEIPDADSEDIVLPIGLANRFSVGVGDTVVVFGQGFQGMQAAGKFRVGGIVKFPLAQQNDLMVYLPIKAAQYLFVAENRLTGILLMADEEKYIEQILPDLQKIADQNGINYIPWKAINPDLISALEFDRASGKVMTLILYMVIAFGIFGTILTMTLEREREFGTMMSLGMRRGKLAILTLIETILMCLIGIVGGIVIGIPVTYYFKKNPIPLGGDIAATVEQFGMEAEIAFSTQPALYYQQAMVVFFIAFMVASYPIWRVFTLNILKAIRS